MTIDVDTLMRFVMFLMAVSSPVMSWFIANGKATAAEIAETRKYVDDLTSKAVVRLDAVDKQMTSKDLRISKLEQDVQHMPDISAIHRIEMNLQKLQGEVEQSMSQWRATQQSIQRLEEYLVHSAPRPPARKRGST